MTPQLNDGKPTGRLNGTQMEVELYVINTSGEKIKCGTRWVEITDEQRQKILAGNNVVVSMGASTDAIEITRSMQTSVHDGRATFRVNDPTMKAVTGDARNVNSAAHYFDPEAIKKLFPEVVETRAEKPKLGEWMDAAGLDMNKLHEEMQKDAKIAGTFTAYTIDAKNRVTTADRRMIQGERRAENSGGNVNYYSVYIANPKRSERPPYTFEVEDLIQALNLGFHEGTILKALIRSATERELGLCKQGNDAIRDAEKMVHSSTEHLRALKLKKAKNG